ncbi:sulfur carrier protein ThiS [Corynebacterium sp. HS2168-gen11]|uniref:sulfur carrier protein ThiS n=1 Tax=Corynebacterium sp. HS2168-gen11 TaxID=2974027 RepID=UPI00216B262A|nr:sulfur carrier protein ThiS [Corynebacterium sp. HS2168-gen11]MCS4536282.1 sulfur carrier protein ThiS [Corynebacterium sp. HS2168-gen11]
MARTVVCNDLPLTTNATTIAEFVITHIGQRDGVAVAQNGVVVLRSAWDHTDIHDGDQLDVLTAVQGG